MKLFKIALNFANTSCLVAMLAQLSTGVAWSQYGVSSDSIWQDYGVNINESLLNPLDAGVTEDDLTRQVARILHTARMDGAYVVRWFVSDVWSQYRCSPDPEDQSSGQLDPAWPIITRILLQQAQRESIRVIVVMADTANGSFIGLPAADDARAAVIEQWDKRRLSQQGLDKYGSSSVSCTQSFQNGYYGHTSPKVIFENPSEISHFSSRFLKMAEFLKQFPALGALEMFNEPDYSETLNPGFANSIEKIRSALYASDPSLKKIPLYSGVASWTDNIAKNLEASGDLAFEPYVNYHYYRKAGQSPDEVKAEVTSGVADMRRMAPGKAVILAEAGAATSIYDLNDHADFLDALLAGKEAAQAGMWMWGNYANDSVSRPDFKWEFNSTALSGESFRKYLIAADREAAYMSERIILFTGENPRTEYAEPVRITQVPADDANVAWRLRWTISVGAERFVGVSRAGILLQDASGAKDKLLAPASVIAVNSATGKSEWAEILKEGAEWKISIFACEAAPANASNAETPAYVINYAQNLGREDFNNCARSSLISSAKL